MGLALGRRHAPPGLQGLLVRVPATRLQVRGGTGLVFACWAIVACAVALRGRKGLGAWAERAEDV